MKICFFVRNHPNYGIGGIGEHVYDISRELAKRGHEIHVIASRFSENSNKTTPLKLVENNVTYHFVEHKKFRPGLLFNMAYNFAAMKKAKELDKKIGFDIFNANSALYGGAFLALSGKKMGKKVLTFHTSLKQESKATKRLFERVFYLGAASFESICAKKSDGLVFVSKFLQKGFGKFPSKTRHKVIYSGIDGGLFYFDKSKNLGKDLVFIGRLVERKGIGELKKLAKILEKMSPSARIIVLGDGPKRKSLEEHKNIICKGKVPKGKVKDYLSKSAAMLFLSRNEGFGLVLVEALACGCPVLALRSGAVEEIIIDKKNGFLFDECGKEMAEKAVLLSTNKSTRRSMGKSASKSANKFSWKRTANEFEDFYLELIKRKNN